MPYKEGQLSFIDYLGYRPVMASAKKGLFGKQYLTYNDYYAVLASVYESAAVLGRARSKKLGILEKMLGAPHLEPELMKSLQEMAKARLLKFSIVQGKDPHSFLEFIQVMLVEDAIPDENLRGLPSAIYCRRQRGRAKDSDTVEVRKLEQHLSKSKKVMKNLEKKISLMGAEPGIRVFGREGVGFGSYFPELTERMYRNLHENIDMLGWSEEAVHALDLPGNPIIITLEECLTFYCFPERH